MTVSTPRPLPAAEGATGVTIVSGGAVGQRRICSVESTKLLAMGAVADPDDAALFSAVWSDDSDDNLPVCRDAQGLNQRSETYVHFPRDHDDIPDSTGRNIHSDRREDERRDVPPAGALNIAALGGIVTKVYLQGLHDRERVVGLVLDQDMLPATQLSILDREGRLAVDFISMNSPARERLRRGAPTLAERVAGDLSRDVTVTVAAHDDDHLALEVRAAAPDGRGPM